MLNQFCLKLHMIGDGSSRGACLEQIIAKVRYVSSKYVINSQFDLIIIYHT